MEVRGQDQNDIRSTVPTSYGLVERRRELSGGGGGGSNNNNNHRNGSTTPPPTTTVLTYTQTLDQYQHRSSSVGSKRGSHERYRECLRNHAASVGGNVYDGCGEFMPSGEEGSFEALKCAACDCHRNFHRKETDGAGDASSHRRRGHSSSTPTGGPPMVHGLQLPAISYHHPHHNHRHNRFPPVVQPMAVAFGGNDSASSEELNVYGHSNNSNAHEHHHFSGGGNNGPPPPPYVLSKKRFRTKFTGEQKEKMMEFAEKIGWRINRQDEGEVDRFCDEAGIRRQVFKVWMHNNKNLRKGGPGSGVASQDQQDQPLL